MNNFDKLKERIEAYLANIPKDRTADVRSLLADILDYADDLMKNGNDGWITVDDELPKPFKNVLVLNNAGKVGIGFVGNSDWWLYNPTGGFNDYRAKSDFFESDLMNVKYWQPLPQPPKEQK